jgi:transcriptional regulator with XRE-family HTH domain
MSFGAALRHRRHERTWSQLTLALEVNSSTRHISCLETNKALPSRELVLRLARVLDVSLREANRWLVLAGHAPHYREQPLHHPGMTSARDTVQRVLRCHEPWPALAMDRHWNIVMVNRMVELLLTTLPTSWTLPANAVDLSISPQGLAPAIANRGPWFRSMAHRLRQQALVGHDERLLRLAHDVERALLAEHNDAGSADDDSTNELVMPLVLHTPWGTLRLLSAITVFGSPVEVTLQELALETFLPADDDTATALRVAFDTLVAPR